MSTGAFSFVLHSHIPYTRLAGRWPHGEEWIHEAASETYIPLLQMLYNLKDEGMQFRLTIGLTPVLAEQLADQMILDNLDTYLNMKIKAAQYDEAYFTVEDESQSQPDVSEVRPLSGNLAPSQPDPHLHYLAQWYTEFYQGIQKAFRERFDRDIIGAFRLLQDEGYIEIVTSAATHGYLPLLSHESSLRAQIETGIQSYERLFGRKPTAIWLPECGYRPAYTDEQGNKHVGIESLLAEYGIQVFFSETHAVLGGRPVGIAAGDVIGPYGAIRRRYLVPNVQNAPSRRETNTYQAYFVSETIKGPDAADHSGVAVIGRNNNTGHQVWSAEWGYPGDFDYREFHKKAGTSGMQYWRVTGAKVDLEHKDYYYPEWAESKIHSHADHFSQLVHDLLRDHHHRTGQYGLIASNYDTELFGHWWFEGVQWIGQVLRHLSISDEVDLVRVSDFLANHPPQETIDLPESSWGMGGNHFTWHNAETAWMWQHIHEVEALMEALASYEGSSEEMIFVLNQAGREVLLMQSSDWPFLITTGQAKEYAIQRFGQHVDRFKRLAQSVESESPDYKYALELYEIDNLFPDFDYRCFRKRK